jgi:hypothetical protein
MPYGFGGSGTAGHSNWKNTTSDRIWCDNKTVVCLHGETGCPAQAKLAGDSNWCSLNMSALKKEVREAVERM